jgi:hypothetical protein
VKKSFSAVNAQYYQQIIRYVILVAIPDTVLNCVTGLKIFPDIGVPVNLPH